MTSHLIIFVLATATLALTPGPNTALMISRTISNGPAAGVVVLVGVELGFFVHLIAASLGITALLFAVPAAYEVLRIVGAAYLLYVALRMVRTGLVALPRLSGPAPIRQLLRMGFLSNAQTQRLLPFTSQSFRSFLTHTTPRLPRPLFWAAFILQSARAATSCTLLRQEGCMSFCTRIALRNEFSAGYSRASLRDLP
jgi:threonine/homoserine/homoserine lactone efflux protein